MSLEASASSAVTRRRELTIWLIGTAVAVAVLLGAVVAMGGRIEAATWGLVVAAGAMVWALRSLYTMALSLARPPIESTLEQEDVAASAGLRELREDRRRVLRAINELQFDYQMGKLSDEDYRAVREGYELRAVEVMRALEAEKSMHPALHRVLRERGLLDELEEDSAAASGDATEGDTEATAEASADADDVKAQAEASADADDAEAEAEASADADDAEAQAEASSDPDDVTTRTCAECEGANDLDAKFCKHCGVALRGKEATA